MYLGTKLLDLLGTLYATFEENASVLVPAAVHEGSRNTAFLSTRVTAFFLMVAVSVDIK